MEDKVARYNQIDPQVEEKVEGLLAQMTLAEKVSQMVQSPGGSADLEGQARNGLGSILSLPDVKELNRLQKIAVEDSRLHIPMIFGFDVIHGYRTTFPIPLAESCTWDMELLQKAARSAADEASANGINWIFAPMIDVSRDPRWGRIAESGGEDPYLGARLAEARVRGFQADDLTGGRRVVACPKHFVGYGAAESGRDYNTVDVSERTLRDTYLPAFKAAFDAGAGTVMTSFNEISGVPSTCNKWLLTDVLRDEWQWPGVVVSDYSSVMELMAHGIAADLKDAARKSVLAGLDMDMASEAFGPYLADLVNAGAVPEKALDEAVRRILRLKIQLGLFEQPYADEALAESILVTEESRALALEVAHESMVLLKNDDDLLPLSPDIQKLAVIGPLADNRRDLLGCWSWLGRAEDAETVLEGLRANMSKADAINYVQGCAIEGDKGLDIAAAVAAAQAADVVLLVVGESEGMSGEAHSRAHLGLPGHQQELLDALAATGKPIAAVLMCGRPLVIPEMVEQVQALLCAWHGGIRAGRAVGDIVFGAFNPTGKLTTTFPRAVGQIPIYYGRKNTGRPPEGGGTKQFEEPFKSTYLDEPNTPLFHFGYGLSYSEMEYSELEVATPTVGLDGTLVVSATVANVGANSGVEIVQLYVRDLVGSVTRPIKELKGFQRIALEPGEQKQVRFEVPVSELGFHGLDNKYTVEPGEFSVWVGPDSYYLLEGEFEVK